MNVRLLLVVLVATLSGAVSAMVVERWHPSPPQIAVIDPARLVAEQLKQLEPGLDEAEIQRRGEAFARRLEAAVSEVSAQYNVVILVSPAVVSGAADLTDAVRRQLDDAR